MAAGGGWTHVLTVPASTSARVVLPVWTTVPGAESAVAAVHVNGSAVAYDLVGAEERFQTGTEEGRGETADRVSIFVALHHLTLSPAPPKIESHQHPQAAVARGTAAVIEPPLTSTDTGPASQLPTGAIRWDGHRKAVLSEVLPAGRHTIEIFAGAADDDALSGAAAAEMLCSCL